MKTQTAAANEIKLQNVLYATDFQDAAQLALPYALSIARQYQSKIYVVHVVDVSPFSAPGPTGALRAIEAQAIREAKEALLECPAFGQVPNEVLIRKGDVGKEISQIVEEKQIDLIVSGTHGRDGVRKVFIGSVAEKIFRQAPCPVLTIGPKTHGDADRFASLHSILVPVDFSRESHAAVLYGAMLAEKHQARMYLLHVNPIAEPAEPSLQQKLLSLIPVENGLTCAPKAIVEAGVPSQEILDLSNELAVDLIVLGVKRPAISAIVASHQMSTACKVVGGAECPIITLRGS
jgi:nucleotide-binding universal stress UspA family protein